MESLFQVLDILLFIVFAANTLYLFIFSIASLFNLSGIDGETSLRKRISVLIPAYKEDAVVEDCVASCMRQDYPESLYDVIVISDKMNIETDKRLEGIYGAHVIKVNFENSTKAKALNFAMDRIGDYDIAVVLDADNTVERDFLWQINRAFSKRGVRIIQCHRTAKNMNTKMALLDAVSEEINNSIFRKGHIRLGFSAALIGSGMAFCYPLYKDVMKTVDAVGGFDRALELTFLKMKERIDYLPNVYVYDEKVQNKETFSNQRRRWMSAQIHYLGRFIGAVPEAFLRGNFDFCDKLLQQMTIPRVMLLGMSGIFSIAASFFGAAYSLKWWILFCLLISALLIAVPRKLYSFRLLLALFELPHSFCLMVLNIFRLRGSNKTFIHTPHGEINK